jgi:hypothetical protein
MIMVAAITNVDEERRIKGMSATQAADQLVQELRKKKLAAYTYEMNETITVFVGDYRSNNDESLKKDLKYIKEGFKPKFLMDEKNGGLFAKTPGRPGPLSKAFVTVNPLLSPEEVKQKSFDKEAMKLTMALNSDGDYSLLKSKGRYTLIIATFHGNSIMQVGNRTDAKAMARFEKSFGSNLDQTGEEAWALTQALREAKKAGYDENYEAWVFHDRHKSVVTIENSDPCDSVSSKTRSPSTDRRRHDDSRNIHRPASPGTRKTCRSDVDLRRNSPADGSASDEVKRLPCQH